MGEGHVPGDCDPKPLSAQEVNLLQYEHGILKARVAELEPLIEDARVMAWILVASYQDHENGKHASEWLKRLEVV